VSTSHETGYYGAALRAMGSLADLPALVLAVAMPFLARAARDDMPRLRYAVEGLGRGALIACGLLILLAVRTTEPVMRAIGGAAFAPSGAVLRIQVAGLLFISLNLIWNQTL